MANPQLDRKYNSDEYAYAVGVVQALQKDIIGSDIFRQMAEASSLETAMRFLSDSSYGEYLADGLPYQDLTRVQTRDLRMLHAKLLPGDALTGMTFIMADFANLKYLVKAFTKRIEPDQSLLFTGWQRPEDLIYLVFEQPAKARNGLEYYYTAALRAFAEYERAEDPATIDLVLDQACFAFLDALFRFRRAEFARGYLALQADLINIQTLFRLLTRRDGQGVQPTRDRLELSFLAQGSIAHAKFTSWARLEQLEAVAAVSGTRYGRSLAEAIEKLVKDANWLSLEKECDELMVAYLRKAKLIATGYEPVFAYFLARENEIRQVRVALNGKAFGLPAVTIRERLWSSYV